MAELGEVIYQGLSVLPLTKLSEDSNSNTNHNSQQKQKKNTVLSI